MFTLGQIDEIHDRVGTADTLGEYVRELGAIGVASYDSFVCDGHSEFLGHDGQRVTSPAAHDVMTIAETSDRDAFLDHLGRHEQGETTYVEMSQGMADSGIERWTVDTDAMTMTFLDRAGNALLVDELNEPRPPRSPGGA